MSFGNVVTIYRLEKYKFYQIGLDNRKNTHTKTKYSSCKMLLSWTIFGNSPLFAVNLFLAWSLNWPESDNWFILNFHLCPSYWQMFELQLLVDTYRHSWLYVTYFNAQSIGWFPVGLHNLHSTVTVMTSDWLTLKSNYIWLDGVQNL